VRPRTTRDFTRFSVRGGGHGTCVMTPGDAPKGERRMAGGHNARGEAWTQEDEDEVTAVMEPAARSTARPILDRTIPKKPPLPSVVDSRTRDSVTEENEIVPELAHLSNFWNIPKLKRPLSRSDVASPSEAYVVSLIETSMSVQAILDVSPMGEEQTLRFLADLITSGVVTWADVSAQRR
jgi:hypothetical protein